MLSYRLDELSGKGKAPDFAIDTLEELKPMLRLALDDKTYLSVHWARSFCFAQDEKIECVNSESYR